MFLEPAFIKLPQGGCKLSVFVFLKRVNFTSFLLRTLVQDYRRLQTLPTTNDTCTKCLESNSKEVELNKRSMIGSSNFTLALINFLLHSVNAK